MAAAKYVARISLAAKYMEYANLSITRPSSFPVIGLIQRNTCKFHNKTCQIKELKPDKLSEIITYVHQCYKGVVDVANQQQWCDIVTSVLY